MRLETVNASVVINASHHNPSILHPSFLTSQQIVAPDWALAEPPICTPPLSIVKFRQGLVFTAEAEKLQVMDNSPADPPAQSMVPELASKYIETLPHVAYTAVGVNFKGFIEVVDASSFLIRTFLQAGPWNDGGLLAQSIGIRFVYEADGAKLRLSLDGGSLSRSTGPSRNGIVVDANYHVALPPEGVLGHATAALARFSDRCRHFDETLRSILTLE